MSPFGTECAFDLTDTQWCCNQCPAAHTYQNHSNYFRFIRLDLEAVPFCAGQFICPVSIGGYGAEKLAFSSRLIPASDQTFRNGF